MSHALNQKYGPQWVVFLWDIGLNYNYSYYNQEELVIEFESMNKRCLVIKWDIVRIPVPQPKITFQNNIIM